MQSTDLARLILARLQEEQSNLAGQWQHPQGTRTRHLVVDHLLPEALAMRIYAAFPGNAEGFYARRSFREKKSTCAQLSDYDPLLTGILYAFQNREVVDAVAQLVGFERIEPDESLYAGGLSMMFKGDFLNPHIDNSHDAKRRRYRRLNLLYYMSPDWQPADGGNLELWDDAVETPKVIPALFNRLVVMETNKTSWHSVSPVVADRPRCCVSNYFFSEQAPDATTYFHVTSFTGRPGEHLKRLLSKVDNPLRNAVSKTLRTGRGKQLINKAE